MVDALIVTRWCIVTGGAGMNDKNVEYTEPMIEIDATPNIDYPLRILRAYRDRCDLLWSSSSLGITENSPLMKMLNDAQKKRAKFLDMAIEILELIL